jgi:SAM-dependent methyltransferase
MEAVDKTPLRVSYPGKSNLKPADLEHHYRVELELAGRLRSAPRTERLRLYGPLYDELFRRVPNHPQLTRKVSEAERRAASNDKFSLLSRFISRDTVFLEVGAGDCAFTMAVADRGARKCYALDVSREILSGVNDPRIETVLSDGCTVPVPAGSVTLAYSFQVMEHIHPDDALEQLRNLFTAIAPGGSYMCVTPSRLNGPHDVSKFFDPVARGFHLKEYTNTELARLFREVGFSRVQPYAGFRGHYLRLPLSFVRVFEWAFDKLPVRIAQRLGRKPLFKNVLEINLRAIK